MRTTKLLAAILVAGLTLSACQQDPDYVLPAIRVASTELNFNADTEQPLEFTATRDWRVRSKPDWVTVTPDQGVGSEAAQRVRITVTSNPNYNREGEIVLSIGLAKATVTISQPGDKGDEANRIAYRNDFDKEVATQTYGTGNAWPFLDQFEGWKNEKGTGADEVAYEFASISVRANSKSDSNYSDYEGSGNNNLFLGPVGNFLKISNIKITGESYTLSFGSEKYLNSGDSKFSHSEFHVYVSNDGEKWVELAYAFPNGDKSGRWDKASSTFSVPSGTSVLSLYFKADVASAYRLDDVSLVVSDDAGTSIDFTTGSSLDSGSGSGNEGGGNEGGGNSGGGSTTQILTVPIGEFLTAQDSDTQKYQLTGTIANIVKDKNDNTKPNAYGNFDLVDDSGTSVYVYGLTATEQGLIYENGSFTGKANNDKSFASLNLKEGDILTLIGYHYTYKSGEVSKVEVLGAYYVSHTAGSN